jgi:hypothetical protein
VIPHDVIFYTSSAGWIVGYTADKKHNTFGKYHEKVSALGFLIGMGGILLLILIYVFGDYFK